MCDEFATSCTCPACSHIYPWQWLTTSAAMTCQYKDRGQSDVDVSAPTLNYYEQEPATNLTCPQVLVDIYLALRLLL